MVINLSIFYYLYLIVVFIFLLFSVFNLYHLLRFGFASIGNIFVIFAYILIAVMLLSTSFELLSLIDWHQPLVNLSNISAGSNNLMLK